MPQFTVYRNANSATRTAVPFLLDVQSDLIADLETRVVVPLYPAAALKGKTIKVLTPEFKIAGKQHVLMTPQLAGVSKKQLGAVVSDCSARRDEIIAALDLLITGF